MHIVTSNEFKAKLSTTADMLIEKSGYLCEIDSKFGDGDHGITIKKIADLIKVELVAWNGTNIGEFLNQLGTKIMGVNGGSAGPLWGTLFSGFGIPLIGKDEINAADLKEMFKSALSEMRDISTAKIGDKTMMDTLIPAVEAAISANDEIGDIFQKATAAAQKGCKDSEGFVAKFGRAKSYKELTIGTPDAGAVSLATLIEGLSK